MKIGAKKRKRVYCTVKNKKLKWFDEQRKFQGVIDFDRVQCFVVIIDEEEKSCDEERGEDE